LRLDTLAPDAMAEALLAAEDGADLNTAALATLSGGSVGEAIRLLNLDGLASYEKLVALFSTLPQLDRVRALALADSITGKANEARYDLLLGLIELFLARLARAGVTGPLPIEGAPGEAKLAARLCPDAYAAMKWAAVHQRLGARARHGRGVNLDPAALVMDMLLEITAAAS
jgi:DNA polymerase-3 subunit delta'